MQFNTGKQIRLFGNCVAIDKHLEIGEGYTLDIFSRTVNIQNKCPAVFNPYALSAFELNELADLNILLWEKLKDNIQKYGLENPKIFRT